MLQSKAGIENREYQAQRSILSDVEAGKITKEELFARGEELLRERSKAATLVTHAPARKAPAPPAVPGPIVPPDTKSGAGEAAHS
jgi:hypothetical protein